jgi:hypothetical protein
MKVLFSLISYQWKGAKVQSKQETPPRLVLLPSKVLDFLEKLPPF